MSRRLAIAALAAAVGIMPSFAAEAAAQNPAPPAPLAVAPSFISSFGPSITLADIDIPALEAEQVQLPQSPFQPRSAGPSATLLSLYASTVAVHALDVHSTLQGLDRGAYEANPLMAGLVNNKAAFIGVKAAVVAGTIYAAHEMSKRNKTRAILTLVAVNSVYAYVAHHNYQVSRRLK